MPPSSVSLQVIRFGVFEADLRSGELRKSGIKIKLRDQPFQVLAMLLERPGELLTRDEIRNRLWPYETYVDFDHGLNNAVNRLREALGDSADSPHFIETLPRRGYRFIGTVNGQQPGSLAAESVLISQRPAHIGPEGAIHKWPKPFWIAIAVAAVLVAGIALLKFRSGANVSPTSIRSLAVLPLQNLSEDPAQEYFADGMTDALITNLARIGSLRVISRTSVMNYKTGHKSLSVIARELNVDAVVEGSVVRSGSRVRINAQLIQAVPERHIWANAYERDVADIVALQGDLARAIANEIQAQLTPEQAAHLAISQPVNPEAYNAYLLGQYFSNRAGKDNLQNAVDYYEQALRLDPGYALAWAGLASAHTALAMGGHVPAEPEKQKARAAVEQAIELAPDLAEAYAVLGSIQILLDWNWTAARVSYNRALALEPGNPSAIGGAGYIAAMEGRYDEAVRLASRLAERAPLDPHTQRALGHAAFAAGRLNESLAAFNRSIQLNPEGNYVHKNIACVYLVQSRAREALREAEKEEIPEEHLVALTMAYHALGQHKESDTTLAELMNKYGDIAAYQVVQAYAFRRENDHAFEWLERAYKQHDAALLGVNSDPMLTNLHGDHRWAAFLKKMQLPI